SWGRGAGRCALGLPGRHAPHDEWVGWIHSVLYDPDAFRGVTSMTQGERDGQTGKGTRRSGRIIGDVLAARPPIDRTLQDCPFAVERTDPINRAVEVAHRWKGSVMPLARDAGVRAAIVASDSNRHGGGGTDGQHHKHHEERTEKRPTRVAGSGRPEVNGDAGVNHTAAAPLIAPYTHLERFTTSQRGYSRGRQRPPNGPQLLDLRPGVRGCGPTRPRRGGVAKGGDSGSGEKPGKRGHYVAGPSE